MTWFFERLRTPSIQPSKKGSPLPRSGKQFRAS